MSGAPTTTSKGDGVADLEQLLRNQVRAASEKAAETGEVPAEQMESMARLKGLIEISRYLAPKPRHRRWPVVATLALALVMASFLFFDRLRSADVEMDVKVSEVAFELSRPYKLWDRLGVTVAGVSGVESIELPAGAGGTSASRADGEFQVEAESNGKRLGAVSLEPLELPAKVTIRLSKTSIPHQYRLSFQSKGVEIRVAARGAVAILRPGAPPARFDFAIPQSVASLSGPTAVDLDFTPWQASTGKLLQEVPIEKLSVSRVEQYADGDQSIARRVSTVLSGSTYFEALGTETAMRPAEEILIGSAVGEIRTLALEDNDIAVKFHGRVTGLTIGFEETARNIMPTRLEWLRALHGLPLLWGTAVYLFTMAAAVIRWWGIDL
jgi:hypothetical protein